MLWLFYYIFMFTLVKINLRFYQRSKPTLLTVNMPTLDGGEWGCVCVLQRKTDIRQVRICYLQYKMPPLDGQLQLQCLSWRRRSFKINFNLNLFNNRKCVFTDLLHNFVLINTKIYCFDHFLHGSIILKPLRNYINLCFSIIRLLFYKI